MFLCTAASYSCHKSNSTPSNTQVDVYVSGAENNGNVYVAKYWKNGNPVNLTDGTNNAGARSMAVSGNNIYIAGGDGGIAKYWKNGTATDLTDSFTIAGLSSIAVSGSDVYLSGDRFDGKYKQGPLGLIAITAPEYWKNGNPVNLSNGANYGTGEAIIVSGNDLYVAGEEDNDSESLFIDSGTHSVAKYWKNGIPVNLTDGSYDAYATSIVISGNDVYVAGYEWSRVMELSPLLNIGKMAYP